MFRSNSTFEYILPTLQCKFSFHLVVQIQDTEVIYALWASV